MLKNKWLALGLSILAIVFIAYRIFFDKSSAVTPVNSAQPLIMATAETGDADTETLAPDLEWADPSGDLLIDQDSPLLLQRIHPSSEMLEPYEPLSSRFGLDVFISSKAEAVETGSLATSEPEHLELNGIVIDETRRLAIVNRQLVKEGEFVGAALVISIESGRVLCRQNGAEIVLESALIPVKRLNDGG